MKKLLTQAQIEGLSPEQLVRYKRELDRMFKNEIEPEVSNFYFIYKYLLSAMANRWQLLENIAENVEDQRLDSPSGEYAPHLFTIQ